MLEPAVIHKEELCKLFESQIYTEDYFFYIGYPHAFELPNLNVEESVYRWAIIDKEKVDGKVVGYFSYRVNPTTDCADQFGWYSFDKGNPIVGYDVFKKLNELVARFHRIEWRVISGNPVVRHYDKFCKWHGGNKVILHDATKDPDGAFRDEYIYEIVNA